MSPEEKEKLESLKKITVRPGTPKDLTVAIEAFIKQAIIVGEYDLESMPTEYMQNLLETMAKYPEYNNVTLSMLKILKANDLM